MSQLRPADYVEPSRGPTVHAATVVWTCGECGRGTERSATHPPRHDGERYFACDHCGARIHDPVTGGDDA